MKTHLNLDPCIPPVTRPSARRTCWVSAGAIEQYTRIVAREEHLGEVQKKLRQNSKTLYLSDRTFVLQIFYNLLNV